MITTSNYKPWRINGIRSFLTYNFLSENVILAGGSLRTLINPEDSIQDFDLFFLGEEIAEIKDKVEKEILANGGKKIFQCKEDELRSFRLHGMKIQLIALNNKKYNSVFELLDSFDINASRVALQRKADGKLEIFLHKEAISDIRHKRVSIHRVTYAVATFKRICKFKEKGYSTTPAIKEFVNQVANSSATMDLETVYVD
jgi:hypothetical protein